MGGHGGDFADGDGYYESTFDGWHERARERARQRREDIKNKYDFRDRKRLPVTAAGGVGGVGSSAAGGGDDCCMFCGVNRGISESAAKEWWLDWERSTPDTPSGTGRAGPA